MLTVFSVPAMATKYDGTIKGDVLKSGTCGKFDGQLGGLYDYNSLEIDSGDTVTIEGNVRVTVNDPNGITKCTMKEDSTLVIYGNLLITAPSPYFMGKIIIKDGGSLKLDVYNIDFVDINSNLVIEGNGKLAITASPNCMSNIENLFRDMPHTIKNNTLIVSNSYVGSVLSEGSLTIICTVAAAVIFGLGGFLLGKKKKKPALASGVENTDEE